VIERSKTPGLVALPLSFPDKNHQLCAKMIPAEISDLASISGGFASLNATATNGLSIRETTAKSTTLHISCKKLAIRHRNRYICEKPIVTS